MQSLPQQTIYPPQDTTGPHLAHISFPTSPISLMLGQHVPNQPSLPIIKGKITGPNPELTLSLHPPPSSLLYPSPLTIWVLTQTIVHSCSQMPEEIQTSPPSGTLMPIS